MKSGFYLKTEQRWDCVNVSSGSYKDRQF